MEKKREYEITAIISTVNYVDKVFHGQLVLTVNNSIYNSTKGTVKEAFSSYR